MTPEEFTAMRICPSVHYGLMTFIPLSEDNDEIGAGTENINRFNPGRAFTWDHWLDNMVKIGAQGVFLTSKHVDGFCLWDSAATASHCVSATTWGATYGRDIFGEFVEGARSRGLKVGSYFAVGDAYLRVQNSLTFGGDYASTTLAQLAEILDYGLDFVVLDAWGSWWSTQANFWPGFSDIPHDTIYNHIKTVSPGTLVAINNHEQISGDINVYEETISGEPRRDYSTTRPAMNWRVIYRTNLPVINRWFDHSDLSAEPLQPALRLAALAQQRTVDSGFVMCHNIPCRPDGRLRSDTQAIVDELANATVPPIWKNLHAYLKFDESSASADALEIIHEASNQSFASSVGAVGTPDVVTGILGTSRTLAGGSKRFSTVQNTASFYSWGQRSGFMAGWCKPTSISNFPDVIAKSSGTPPGFEYEFLIDTGHSNQPSWRVSGNGTDRQDINSAQTVVAGTPFFFLFGIDIERGLQYLSINGETILTAAWTAGIADSIQPFTLGCRGAGGQPFSGILDELMWFIDRGIPSADEIALLYNGGIPFPAWSQSSLASFNVPVKIANQSLIRKVFAGDTTSTAGAGKSGLVFGDFVAKYDGEGVPLASLTTETITTLGTYQTPTSAAHARIKEINIAAPTTGCYEVHLHASTLQNAINAGAKKLWLYLSASGASVRPLEIDLSNDVTHVGGLRVSPRDIGAGVTSRVDSLRGSKDAARRLLDFERKVVLKPLTGDEDENTPAGKLNHLTPYVEQLRTSDEGRVNLADGAITDDALADSGITKLAQAVKTATRTPVSNIPIPPSRLWVLVDSNNGLVGQKTLAYRKSDGDQVFGVDFRNDLTANGRLATVGGVGVVSAVDANGDPIVDGLAIGSADGDIGCERSEAKFRLILSTEGVYQLLVSVTYDDSDGGTSSGLVTLDVR